MAEEAVINSEGTIVSEGNGGRILGFIALGIYFLWGQGTACAWWMWIVIIGLTYLALTNSAKVFQWLLGLFLIGITFFASPTFGYSQRQLEEYNAGLSEGRFYYNVQCIDCDWEWAWEQKQERAREDISGWKRFYKRGYKRGYSGKDE